MSKVFDIEGPLEARSKESSEWRYQRGEGGHDEAVDLERSVVESWDVTKLHAGQCQISLDRQSAKEAYHRGNDLLDWSGQL